jgi:hypothetical protein
LQKDFAHLGEQHSLKVRRACATLIQNPFVPIRLLRVSILQIPRGDFCNNIGTKRRKTMSALRRLLGVKAEMLQTEPIRRS